MTAQWLSRKRGSWGGERERETNNKWRWSVMRAKCRRDGAIELLMRNGRRIGGKCQCHHEISWFTSSILNVFLDTVKICYYRGIFYLTLKEYITYIGNCSHSPIFQWWNDKLNTFIISVRYGNIMYLCLLQCNIAHYSCLLHVRGWHMDQTVSQYMQF